ncbi:hypothetical protein NC653_006566 [Populus alba x Populus x berolinensis]|uniref:Uncharacterized protein n=1 Tax=Populus alba x Populus x berolinensis TaxID=444605 RepID=A0AAD6REV6_9ROSI|nr:hypothetical protein NC653_006507 [Populus alba x Populus x berolinensis]KAJ7007566.1 hypothetical protein NC653_006566 [Populus alba x Populus x berolinensis]
MIAPSIIFTLLLSSNTDNNPHIKNRFQFFRLDLDHLLYGSVVHNLHFTPINNHQQQPTHQEPISVFQAQSKSFHLNGVLFYLVENNRNFEMWTASSIGRTGIAPFLVVVMTPHTFANLSISLIFGLL